MSTYHRDEIKSVLDSGDDPDAGEFFRLKVTGPHAESKHLNVTAAQLAAIADILADDNPSAVGINSNEARDLHLSIGFAITALRDGNNGPEVTKALTRALEIASVVLSDAESSADNPEFLRIVVRRDDILSIRDELVAVPVTDDDAVTASVNFRKPIQDAAMTFINEQFAYHIEFGEV